MAPARRKRTFIGDLTRRLLAVAGALVIVLALAAGAFRLLVAQLPGYQAQMQAWVVDTLGLDVDFERIDVRLGLRGPELTFHEARVGGAGQSDPFLSARQARVRIDARALLTERTVRFNELAFDETRLVLVRDADGQLSLQGAPLLGLDREEWRMELPPELDVTVHDSSVVYIDHERDVVWEFEDLGGTLSHADNEMALSARARPPTQLAGHFELSLQAWAPTLQADGPVSLHVAFDDLDLAELARALPELADLPQAGRGDVAADLTWTGSSVAQVNVELALSGARVAGTAIVDRDAGFDELRLTAKWLAADSGWQLDVADVVMVRDGRSWPDSAHARVSVSEFEGSLVGVDASGSFLRIEDLVPLMPAELIPDAARDWLAAGPAGDVRDFTVSLTHANGEFEYDVAAQFDSLDVPAFRGLPEVRRLSGDVRADARSGRLNLESRDLVVDWPQLFRDTLTVRELNGLLVWREGREGVRIVSDNLLLANDDASTHSNLELTWPLDGTSPTLELATVVTDATVPAVRRYLPEPIMSPGLVRWLDHALAAGRVLSAEVTFVGPVRAFPFDGGEGQFRVVAEVEDGVLAYLPDWPAAEDLNGTVEFLNASFDARGSGRVLNHSGDNIHVGIADLRNAQLAVNAETFGPLPDVLHFLREVPLTARQLGPEFERVVVLGGDSRVVTRLHLPLFDHANFDLRGSVAMMDGDLAISGVAARATDINGVLEFTDGTVSGEGINAMLLDGPVTARVDSVPLPGYRARVAVEGEVDVQNVLREFGLPADALVSGRTRWQGSLLLPVNNGNGGLPIRASVNTNLSGVELDLPAPFAKSSADAVGLRLDFLFPDRDSMELRGDFGATRRFALGWRDQGEGLALERGTLRFGGAWPELPDRPGLLLDGALGAVQLDEWLALVRALGDPATAGDQLLGAHLSFVDLAAFGQQLGETTVQVVRQGDAWMLDIDSAPVAGQVTLRQRAGARAHLEADMLRLHLLIEGGRDLIGMDPRDLPGLALTAEQFAIAGRRFGRVEAEVVPEPLGLRMTRFTGEAVSFNVAGSGGWFLGPQGAGTQVAFELRSSDVGVSLEELGFERFAEGQSGEISASVYWPGSPSGDWARHINGELAVRVNTGSLVDVQPGAGRLVGLMSITALPRRLALDFRDVFQRGLVFDRISGDFLINDGDAYTSNLRLTGPAVEIGVAGRTGLRDHDYQQFATVTAEPGKMLPTVGGLLGGPGVGAALLLFTHIFREPLKGLGRVNYCVTGSWEDPQVERIASSQGETTQGCAVPGPEVRFSSAVAESGMQ